MASSRLLREGQDRLSKADEADPASPAGSPTAERPGLGSAAAIVSTVTVPAPYTATEDGQLSATEHDYLAACEAALDSLRLAFWAAGKALQVIRDARLYRETHDTFEAYVEDRWQMSRPQAYRRIDAWPLAERLSPIGDKLNKRLNEGQVRELLPLAEIHGRDAAETVYSTVAETDGVTVTAAVLHGVVGILPADRFDPAEAAEQIRAYLAGAPVAPGRSAADPVGTVTAESAKILRALHRVSSARVLRAALDADPDAVRRLIAEVRAGLDALEHDLAGRSADGAG